MRKWHIRVGLIFVAVFLATGLYMVWMFSDGQHDHGKRMMYRSAHVYILMSALINLVLGTYYSVRAEKRMAIQQRVGSIFLLFAPPVFIVAFFVEPGAEVLERPVALVGVFALFMGVLLHWNACTRPKRPTGEDN